MSIKSSIIDDYYFEMVLQSWPNTIQIASKSDLHLAKMFASFQGKVKNKAPAIPASCLECLGKSGNPEDPCITYLPTYI